MSEPPSSPPAWASRWSCSLVLVVVAVLGERDGGALGGGD